MTRAMSKKTHVNQNRPTKETYKKKGTTKETYKRDLQQRMYRERTILSSLMTRAMSKTTRVNQKRPAKETYKTKDLQKRPTKETYNRECTEGAPL